MQQHQENLISASDVIDKIESGSILLLQHIRATPEIERISARLKLNVSGSLTDERILGILKDVTLQANPRAACKLSRKTRITKNTLELDGVEFNVPLLKVNLAPARLIFPFMVTAGEDLESVQYANGSTDLDYCLKTIKELMLDETCNCLQKILQQKFHLPYIWSLVPGEFQAWPLSGNKNIFQIGGDLSQSTGIKLQSDFSLSPLYSRCGFFYYTEAEFEGCQVCAKEPCMMRRAQYSPDLARQKGLRIRRVCGKDTA